jgi:hypothetical protein
MFVFLFFFCLVLFTWPLLSVVQDSDAEAVFYYLYLSWGLVILLLFLSRKSTDIKASTETDPDKQEVNDV